MSKHNVVDGAKELLAHLQELAAAEDAPNRIDEYLTVVHNLHIPDAVGTCYGSATVEEDSETSAFNFAITLGAYNARRLVDFLLSLPDEPDEDGSEETP